MKEKLLISACLLGRCCKYNGGHNLHPLAKRLGEKYELVAVCPESLGGLPISREPSERVGDRVLSKSGLDVTAAFRRGAERAVELAKKTGAKKAVLKERSPSCGFGKIYDGSFTGTVIPGNGVAAQALAAEGVAIWGESRIEELLGEDGP